MSKENDYQSEPVAWFMPELMGDNTIIGSKVKAAHFTIPLYAHADNAEFEQIRAELDRFKHLYDLELGRVNKAEGELISYAGQLAEAHALLRDAHEELVCRNSPVAKRIDEALFASAEPSFENKGIKNHDGQKLLVQHILDNDKGLSDSSRVILEKLIE